MESRTYLVVRIYNNPTPREGATAPRLSVCLAGLTVLHLRPAGGMAAWRVGRWVSKSVALSPVRPGVDTRRADEQVLYDESDKAKGAAARRRRRAAPYIYGAYAAG